MIRLRFNSSGPQLQPPMSSLMLISWTFMYFGASPTNPAEPAVLSEAFGSTVLTEALERAELTELLERAELAAALELLLR